MNSTVRASLLVVLAAAAVSTASAQDTVETPGDRRHPSAIVNALDWLARHQGDDRYDGRWRADAFGAKCVGEPCGGATDSYECTRTTALAALAFLGAGETHQSGAYRNRLKETLKILRDLQSVDSGFIGVPTAKDARLADAFAAFAVNEWYGMTGSKVARPMATLSVGHVAKAQDASGGWKSADADADCDLVLTAVCVQVLRAGKMSELDVADAAFDRAIAWLDARCDAKTGAPRDAVRAGGPSADALAAAAATIRFCGRFDAAKLAKDEAFQKETALLASHLPTWDDKGGDVLAWSFAASPLVQAGGPAGKQWWAAFVKLVDGRQRADAKACGRGSWDPDPRAPFGGRVATTALLCRAREAEWSYRLPKAK